MAGLIILLSSLLISFIASSSPSPDFITPVVDIDGHAIKTGEAYYVLSNAASILQVGICREKENVVQCPFSKGDDPRGLPIVFTAVNNDYAGDDKIMADDTIVRENASYNIFFLSLEFFTEETFWYLKDGRFPDQQFVVEGPSYLAMEFSFKKIALGYKILYCVSIPIPRIPLCYPLGFNPKSGYNRLGIGQGVRAGLFTFEKNTTLSYR